MKKILTLLFCSIILSACKAQDEPKVFSTEALNDTFITLENETISFKEILENYKDKTIVIDVWASWCGDCIKGMPKVKALQKQFPNVEYVFLSLDKKTDAWKKGIEKYNVVGNHYYMKSGWKGKFGNFLDLDWIPRYMVVDKNKNITVFKAITADDTKIINALK